jgi:hypothetical protein
MSSNDYTETNNSSSNNNNNNADTSMTVDHDDNDDDAETETETDRILSLLKDVVGNATKEFPTTSPAEQGERKQYEKCLLSFKATTYFSKPTCLSPMFCSRFGYVAMMFVYCIVLYCIVLYFFVCFRNSVEKVDPIYLCFFLSKKKT